MGFLKVGCPKWLEKKITNKCQRLKKGTKQALHGPKIGPKKLKAH